MFSKSDYDKAMKEFLAQGGKIEQGKPQKVTNSMRTFPATRGSVFNMGRQSINLGSRGVK
jgi:hypothetical protein